eukprot:m51a1_g10090 hypothetical protein (199) ;mRNA; r:100217-100933
MKALLHVVVLLHALGLCAGLVPHWGSCQATSDCDPTPVQGKPVCCHVGDRRCLTMDDCDWVNWIEKAKEPRDCDCIANRGGSARRWDSCGLSSECDPSPTSDGTHLCCREGDNRCLTKDDCDWVNWIGHTQHNCACRKDMGKRCEIDEDCATKNCWKPFQCTFKNGTSFACHYYRDCGHQSWEYDCTFLGVSASGECI